MLVSEIKYQIILVYNIWESLSAEHLAQIEEIITDEIKALSGTVSRISHGDGFLHLCLECDPCFAPKQVVDSIRINTATRFFRGKPAFSGYTTLFRAQAQIRTDGKKLAKKDIEAFLEIAREGI